MDSAKLIQQLRNDGEDAAVDLIEHLQYRLDTANAFGEQCMADIAKQQAELDALRALRARVEAAPIGTAWLDAHPWPTIDDIDVEKGRRFRLLAVDAGEVGNG